MLKQLSLILVLSLLWAQGLSRWNELKKRFLLSSFYASGEESAPYARGSELWVPESIRTQSASAQGWENHDLKITRYDGFGRPVWDSSFTWTPSEWRLRERIQYLRYRAGSFIGWDSVIVRYAPIQAMGREHYFYMDLGGGRVRIEVRDSIWSSEANRWIFSYQAFIWTPRSRWLSQRLPDSIVAYVNDNGNLVEFGREQYFFRGDRLDSVFRRFIIGEGGRVAGYTRYFYDFQNRLVRERDSFWVISPSPGPIAGGWIWYFYQANSMRPFKDSSYFRSYGDGTVDRRVATYTYDPRGNLSVKEVDTCSVANPAICQDYERILYSYIRQQTPTSLEAQVSPVKSAIPSLLRTGDRILIEANYAVSYRIIDALGRLWDQGYLPAGESTLALPLQSGLYILQIGSYQQKILLLP